MGLKARERTSLFLLYFTINVDVTLLQTVEITSEKYEWTVGRASVCSLDRCGVRFLL